MQNEDIIRYDVGGRPTFFTVLETLVKITEDTKNPAAATAGPRKEEGDWDELHKQTDSMPGDRRNENSPY